MRDRTVLITGATDGIGKQTALELARMGARVLLHGRDRAKGKAVLAELRAATGNERLSLLTADLASLSQVRDLADEVCASCPRLDALVNNAAVHMPQRQLTEDGIESTFAINHLAPFLLTQLLLDLLKASAPARIVNVSSDAHLGARLDFDAGRRRRVAPAVLGCQRRVGGALVLTGSPRRTIRTSFLRRPESR